MIKKAIIIGGVVLLVGGFFLGRDAVSYLKTSAGVVQSAVRDNVPVEFEIERARNMLAELGPEVRNNMQMIAKEEVEVARLQSEIKDREEVLAKAKSDILRLRDDLEQDRASYTYGGRIYTVSQVKMDLTSRFERFKTREATLENLRKVCDARQRNLDAAQLKLEGMRAARRQLEVEIENLQAQNQMLAASKSTSEYVFDSSQLGRIRKLVNDLGTRLDVDAKLLDAEVENFEGIQLDETAPSDVLEQVTTYFEGDVPTDSIAMDQ